MALAFELDDDKRWPCITVTYGPISMIWVCFLEQIADNMQTTDSFITKLSAIECG